MPSADKPPIVKPTNQARQGATGHNVRWVLGLGILGVVALFAVLWLSWFG